jgi:hypothetical protein
MGRQVLFEEADVQAETLDMSLADHLRQGDVLNRRPDSDDLDAAPHAFRPAVHGAYSAGADLAARCPANPITLCDGLTSTS